MKENHFSITKKYLTYPMEHTERAKDYTGRTIDKEISEMIDKFQHGTQAGLPTKKEEMKPFSHRVEKIGQLLTLAFKRNGRIKSAEIGPIAKTMLTSKQKDLETFGIRVERILYSAMQMAQDEIGPMSDRILIMAGHIGTMADRIGEMANRIVHTEHLIVNSAVLLVDLGLLLEAAIRNFTESFLYTLSIIFNRNFQPVFSSTKHLDIISENIRQILAQQHEFSLKMIESQTGLRDNTLKTYDKVYSRVR